MKSSRLRRRPEIARCPNRCRPQVESLESRELLSVTVGQAHTGIASTGFIPPDPVGAVGPNYYVEEVNTSMAIYNKSTGALVSSKTLNSFFSSLGSVHSLSDPFVFYDQLAGKFVTGILDYTNTTSAIDFGVSNTSDPTGSWTLHRYDTTNDGSSNHSSDYPRFGYNREAYVISYNQFGAGVHVDTLAINKSNLASSFIHQWSTSQIAAPGMSPTVMHDSSSTSDPMWFVGLGGTTSIKVIKMTNVLSSSPGITVSSVSVPSYSGSGTTFHQPGSPATFSVQNDSRILDAAMYNGKLVASHTIGATGGYHAARWYEFNTTGSTPTLITSGQVTAASTDDYYPTVDINSAGAIGMTYMENSANEYMSMYVTGRTASDPAGQMEAAMSPSAVHGTTRYGTSGRAGDYSGMSVDPSDNTTFWAANEFKGSSSLWNTGVVKFSLSGGALPATHFSVTSSVDSGGTIAGNVFDVTVTALDDNGNVVPGYRGTVTFSSGDPYGASVPSNYTFTASDQGSVTFYQATALYTAGTYDVTATDVSSGITGSDYIYVVAAPATGLYIQAPSSAGSGSAFDVTVYATDPYGNVDTNYQGTITWTSTDTDPNVVLPADYQFQTTDQGQVTFPGGVTLITQGDQFITATDTSDNTITGSADVTVTAGPSASSSHGHGNAALTLALPKSAPVAVPTSSAAAGQTLVVAVAPARTGQREIAVKPLLPDDHGYGILARPVADSLGTAALDLVLTEWNQGLNPTQSLV
jgi:hypothetical protein